MEDAFRFVDDLGPTKILHIYQPQVGLKATLVVDNVAMGPAIGGCARASTSCAGRDSTRGLSPTGRRRPGRRAIASRSRRRPVSTVQPWMPRSQTHSPSRIPRSNAAREP